MEYVVDVNVPIVSKGNSPQATRQCELNCIKFLELLQQQHKIVIDSRGKILSEYTRHLASEQEPSVASEFYKWVISNQVNPAKCEAVDIHANAQRVFNEFPADSKLRRFDRNDRKYVAVAIAHPAHPEIAQAVDTKWKPYETALRKYKVRIIFL
jgi:hypothetical protein